MNSFQVTIVFSDGEMHVVTVLAVDLRAATQQVIVPGFTFQSITVEVL